MTPRRWQRPNTGKESACTPLGLSLLSSNVTSYTPPRLRPRAIVTYLRCALPASAMFSNDFLPENVRSMIRYLTLIIEGLWR